MNYLTSLEPQYKGLCLTLDRQLLGICPKDDLLNSYPHVVAKPPGVFFCFYYE